MMEDDNDGACYWKSIKMLHYWHNHLPRESVYMNKMLI